MTALALRGLGARKLRTALTALAIVLGVGMIAGSYVLTDTINRSFENIFAEGAQGVDVKVEARQAFTTDEDAPPPIDASIVEQVREVDGVQEAVGEVFSNATLLDRNGEPVGTNNFPGLLATALPERFDPFEYTAGRPPSAPGEVAIDAGAAENGSLAIGDSVRVAGPAGTATYEITGIARYGTADSIGGTTFAILPLAPAQELAGFEGEVSDVLAGAEPGTSPEELRAAVEAELPGTVQVETGEADAAGQSEEVAEGLGFLTTALLAFGFIALFVGGFTIFNTFSITVAQRTREFAMLRTLGATRRQVLGSVVLEALAIGIGASLVGLAAGIGFAEGINALFRSIGIDLPRSGLVIAARTILVALLAGTVLTVLAGLAPALRATRVAPIEALREGAVLPRARGARLRMPIGGLMSAGGVALIALALFGSLASGTALSLLGFGAGLLFLGVALLSPLLVPPLASAVGAPIERAGGLVGRLARENTVRNTGRTAVTAAALMIGVALVVFVTIFAAGARASIERYSSPSSAGDVVVQADDGFSNIPAAVARAVADVEGVAAATATRFAVARVQGMEGNREVMGVEPATFGEVLDLEWAEGSQATLAELRNGGVIVRSDFAEENGLEVGERVSLLTAQGGRPSYTVRGLLEDPGEALSPFVLDAAALQRDFGERQDRQVHLALAPGADAGAVERRATALLEQRFPTADALTRAELRDQQTGTVNQLLGLIYALLSLAVVVSLFGIVNTLALAILERTRELGMLRAIGLSRRQMRRMVRYESVITALIGAVLGLVLGVFFGAIVSEALADDGFVFSLPVPALVAILLLAGLAGVLAAILPARRAGRLDVLRALQYE